ncbi:hypothetical protein [Erwinia endophytica]|uniref:hypothetical protein n=1 Tax=Erwinia endophytica TaxID=1563158 RepID=UPI003084636E
MNDIAPIVTLLPIFIFSEMIHDSAPISTLSPMVIDGGKPLLEFPDIPIVTFCRMRKDFPILAALFITIP